MSDEGTSEAPEKLAQVIPTAVCSACKQWRIIGIDGVPRMKATPSSWQSPCYPCAIWSRRVQFITFGDPDPTDPPKSAA